ncbi:hypothetical protein E4U54_005087 [Claviceps lovelessii]|nr:hypothetical protein E4U54_005087 [Claviceps lovelessii]
MDQQAHNAQSSSTAGHDKQQEQISHINQGGLSPSLGGQGGSSSVGLGLDLDAQSQSHPPSNLGFATSTDSTFDTFTSNSDFLHSHHTSSQHTFHRASVSDSTAFDPSASFGQQPTTGPGADGSLPFDTHTQSQSQAHSPYLNDGDFSLFPSAHQGDQFNNALFEQASFSPSDMSSMTSPPSHHAPAPPNPRQIDNLQSGTVHPSPCFSQHNQFSPPQSRHSRNASLGPEAALLSTQMGDWTQPQFQRHRRSPSEFSDVSSVSPSPNLVSVDSFDDLSRHSPLQRASDGSLYQDVLNIESFNINDGSQHGRSPSHSPAISPRITPQQIPDTRQMSLGLAPPNAGFGGGLAFPGMQHGDSFPPLMSQDRVEPPHMAPPAINIDFAPSNAKQGAYEPAKPRLDQDSLTPPERGA